jgi:hypothetical protein
MMGLSQHIIMLSYGDLIIGFLINSLQTPKKKGVKTTHMELYDAKIL